MQEKYNKWNHDTVLSVSVCHKWNINYIIIKLYFYCDDNPPITLMLSAFKLIVYMKLGISN